MLVSRQPGSAGKRGGSWGLGPSGLSKQYPVVKTWIMLSGKQIFYFEVFYSLQGLFVETGNSLYLSRRNVKLYYQRK